jgi:hypothetical protein
VIAVESREVSDQGGRAGAIAVRVDAETAAGGGVAWVEGDNVVRERHVQQREKLCEGTGAKKYLTGLGKALV